MVLVTQGMLSYTDSTHLLVLVPSPYSYDDDTIHRSNAYSHSRACVTVVVHESDLPRVVTWEAVSWMHTAGGENRN